MIDASTGRPWDIPTSGEIVMHMTYVCDKPSVFDIVKEDGMDSLIR
jgi:hypothetical protein